MTEFDDHTFLDKHENLQKVTALLKAVANEKRLKIMCVLSGGEKSVGELEKVIDLSQSALSQHLARLRRDRVVTTRRDAQTIYYSILDNNVVELVKHACVMVNTPK